MDDKKLRIIRSLKKSRCKAKGCDNKYIKFDSLTQWCSPACGAKLALEKMEKKKARKVKQARRDVAASKKEFRENDKSWCRARAKEELHRWIKYVRDVDMPCISCGNANPSIKYDAGHFRSVGSAKELEMEPRNIHKQCSVNCNQHLSSNRAGYEQGLIARYGQAELDWLKGPHEPKRYKADDYLKIRDYYRGLNKAAGVMPYQITG